ncbi:MAG: hypothetical protein U1A78_39085 [Polyangia bacterium]
MVARPLLFRIAPCVVVLLATPAAGQPPAAPALRCDPWLPAKEPIYLWGVQRSCEIDPQATRDVLTEATVAYHRALRAVRPQGPLAAPGCTGAACIEALRQQPGCQDTLTQGSVLGARIDEEGAGAVARILVWRHDLDTGQTWEYALDPRVCLAGVCGDGRFADQDIKRLRPSQRVAVALGRLMQARIDNDFRSCMAGCQPPGTAEACLPPPHAECAAAAPALAAPPEGEPRPAAFPVEPPAPARAGRTALAFGFAASAVTLITLGALTASPLADRTLCATGTDCGTGWPAKSVFVGGLWIAGGAALVSGAGLVAVLGYDHHWQKQQAASKLRLTHEDPKAMLATSSSCLVIVP